MVSLDGALLLAGSLLCVRRKSNGLTCSCRKGEKTVSEDNFTFNYFNNNSRLTVFPAKINSYLSVVKAIQVTIKENSFWAKLAAAKLHEKKVAIVFGRTIHLHNTSAKEFLADERWVKHELKHIEQYMHYGFIGFIFRYFIEWLRRGYYNNRFEKEARACECEEGLEERMVRFKVK